MNPTPKKNLTRQIILDAVRSIAGDRRLPTRETVSAVTGLAMTTVDEHCCNLIDDGILMRAKRGAYWPIRTFPAPRACSLTAMEDGMALFELGDEVIHLTPREAEITGILFGGYSIQSSMKHLVLQLEESNADNSRLMREIRRRENEGKDENAAGTDKKSNPL